MSDPQRANRLTLGDALRALPHAAPDRDGWPALAAALAPRRATSRYTAALALAACALLVALGAREWHVRMPPAHVPTATVAPPAASAMVNGTASGPSTHAAALAQLQQRSRALERWLRQTGSDASPLPGQDLAAAAEIENLIGLIDVELAAPRQTHAQALWQRRVDLLEDLSALRYSNYRLAAGALATASTQID
jgi:hypothetical protein